MSRDLLLSPACLSGRVKVPPSKSVAHRALLCAALAGGGSSMVRNIAPSDDILATLGGAAALGARMEWQGDAVVVHAAESRGAADIEPALIDCKESGSTLRFLLPVALALGRPVRMIGQGNLGKRPLDAYFAILREQGIPFEAAEGRLDLTLRGRLRPGVFRLPGNVSSQYITGLLLALPLLDGPSRIVVEGPLESKGYLDLTLQVMRAFGAGVSHDAYRVFEVKPGGYRPADYTVEGDYSQAAFFLAAGALAGVRRSLLGDGGSPGDFPAFSGQPGVAPGGRPTGLGKETAAPGAGCAARLRRRCDRRTIPRRRSRLPGGGRGRVAHRHAIARRRAAA